MTTVKNIKEEIIEMYIDWTLGRDEEIKMSDWMYRCYIAGLTVEEITNLGDKRIKEERLIQDSKSPFLLQIKRTYVLRTSRPGVLQYSTVLKCDQSYFSKVKF